MGRLVTMSLAWNPDVLGGGFEAATLSLAPDDEGEVVATLVRAPAPTDGHGGAVLYLHGFSDYFFQVELAAWFRERGWAFYALDLRKYGRSLRPHQTPNLCASLTDYDEELDAAAEAITAAGHSTILLMGHSTGGLTLPLWAARRHQLPLAGLVLNSPFLELPVPLALRLVAGPLAWVVSRRNPKAIMPGEGNGLYGESLHASRRGEWDYDLSWKPIHSAPVHFGWLQAVTAGHRQVRTGLDLDIPVLSMSSTRSIMAKAWTPALQDSDAVLDASRIAQRAVGLGRNVTIVRIEGGMHDLILSPRPTRDHAYEAIGTWLQGWAPGAPSRP